MIANGDVWNDFATVLDGGTPLQPNDVLRPNGFTGTLGVADDVVTLSQLRNDALAPAGAGGQFVLPDKVIVNADVIRGFINSQTLLYSGSIWAAINGDVSVIVSASGGSNRLACVRLSNSGNLIVNGISTGGSNTGTATTNNNIGVVVSGNGRLDIIDVKGGSAYATQNNNPVGVRNDGGQVYITGRAVAGVCEAVRGSVASVGIAESLGSREAIAGNVTEVTNRLVWNNSRTFPITGAYAFAGAAVMEFIEGSDSYVLGENADSTLDPSEVRGGVVYDNGSKMGTLEVVDVQQLASDLLTEMNASNLAIAEGLRDGMGASAAAIAAIASIKPVP